MTKIKGKSFLLGIDIVKAAGEDVISEFQDNEDGIINTIYFDSSNLNSEDKNDEFVGKEEKLLLNSTKYSVEELVKITYQNNGIPVPSHAERSFGIIQNLGFIPGELEISFVEMNFHKKYEDYLKAESNYLNSLSTSFTQYATIISRQ